MHKDPFSDIMKLIHSLEGDVSSEHRREPAQAGFSISN
jgi:hypothetical protein